ncbi:hypothetical protein BAUCODRAFT_180299 [Baudoinia panamericana UAMH 10762]|uniref:Uncharacterized protein n=1 Tax=Baudoinia panamericana (strain UAMH 10762) TaxID=717646 RepID=M2NN89_BAUPA|nr:uncharacterized protein BAUCODRAFT_180299 [Baudoinia panamericana UAMH 10762]EMD00696.1 hypothetical protein BAUCODRAFT_180299 [Baudoinia panamericana UAMH 10762]
MRYARVNVVEACLTGWWWIAIAVQGNLDSYRSLCVPVSVTGAYCCNQWMR